MRNNLPGTASPEQADDPEQADNPEQLSDITQARSQEQSQQRGILRPQSVGKQFHLAIHEPSDELRPFVERYWIVHWDLREPYLQETLPHPSVHIVLERGSTTTARILGVMRHRFTRLLTGSGFVFGIKFRPGGFYPFFRQPLAQLTDRSTSLETVFGEAGTDFESAYFKRPYFKARQRKAAHAETMLSDNVNDDVQETIAQAERLLLAHLPARDEMAELVAQIINSINEDPSITRVEQLANRWAMQTRTLQRLFRRYVGVGPKWVIERYRLHEAVTNLADDAHAQAALAQDLGYFDQAHFAKAFKKTVGTRPLLYAQRTKP